MKYLCHFGKKSTLLLFQISDLVIFELVNPAIHFLLLIWVMFNYIIRNYCYTIVTLLVSTDKGVIKNFNKFVNIVNKFRPYHPDWFLLKLVFNFILCFQ